MKDEKLYGLWRTLLSELLKLWKSNRERTKSGVIIINDQGPSEGGTFNIGQFAFKKEVKDLDSYKNFVSHLEELAPKGIAKKSWNVLNHFFEQYAQKEDNLWNLNIQRFDELYQEYEKAIFSESYSYKAFLFIAGVIIRDGGEFQLKDNIGIRNMTFEDELKVSNAITLGNNPGDIHSEVEIGPKLVVSFHYDLDWESYGSLSVASLGSPYDRRLSSPFPAPNLLKEKVYEDKTKVLLSLRLLGAGDVIESLIIWEKELPWERGLRVERLDRMWANNRLEITENNIDNLRELYELIEDVNLDEIDNLFKRAVLEFSSSYDRTVSMDKLLDFTRALEALYADPGGNTKIGTSERARRVAIILGSSLDERQKVKKNIKEIFQKRGGKAAHGTDSLSEVSEDTITDAEEYTRQSLRKFFEFRKEFGGRGNFVQSLQKSMMGIKFPENVNKEFIAKWHPKYDDFWSDENKYRKIRKEVRSDLYVKGTISKKTFKEIYKWKTKNRSRRYVEWDNFEEYRKSTKECLKAKDAEKLSILTDLPGVGPKVGSAVLHFMYPDSFPIMDAHSLSALEDFGRGEIPNKNNTKTYSNFRQVVLKYLKKNPEWSLRQLDRALLAYDKHKTE